MMKRKTEQSEELDRRENRLSELLFNNQTDVTKKIKNENSFGEAKERLPVWSDEDDIVFTAKEIMDTKNKDLYTNCLKQKYVTLMGTPNWAKLDRIKTDNDDDVTLRSVGHLKNVVNANLSKEHLEIKRFPRINSETKNEGPIIKCLEFHPKTNVALVGGQSGIVSLFTVGGDVNNKLHSVRFNNFRMLSSKFTPEGSEAFLVSDVSHQYYIYNLVNAQATELQFPQIVLKPTVFELSPCGQYMALADGYDVIYLINAVSKELLKSLKQNSKVQAVTFSPDSKKIYSFDDTGVVTTWDLLTYRVSHKFSDEGCISGSVITASPCGRLLATGSNEGIVNVYNCSDMVSGQVTPHHSLQNLRTKITGLKFNAASEILAFWSSYYPNAIKLAHIPSYHVFYNFPDQSWNLNQVAAFNFSPNSGFMGLSNNKNYAHLYRLKHYKNY